MESTKTFNNLPTVNKEPIKVSKTKEKVAKKKKQRVSKKIKVFAVTLFLTILGVLLFKVAMVSLVMVNSFFDSSRLRFQNPIIIQTPVKVEKRVDIISPLPEEEASPSAQPAQAQQVLQIVEPVMAADRVLKGEASYYSTTGCMGCDINLIMANGQKLDDNALTLALPPEYVNKYKLLNDMVRIVNLKSGQTVIAKVTDTGGFYQLTGGKRIADLSVATKDALGCNGLCQVEVHY